MTQKRAADLQPGNVVDLDEDVGGGDVVTIEKVASAWSETDTRLLVFVEGDPIPVRLYPDDQFTILEPGDVVHE